MRISDWSSDVCSSDLRPAPAGRGQVQAKARPVAIAPMLDGAAHVARELCDERKAQPPALALGGHEGIEQVAADVGGNAGSIVAEAAFDRQGDAAPPVGLVEIGRATDWNPVTNEDI